MIVLNSPNKLLVELALSHLHIANRFESMHVFVNSKESPALGGASGHIQGGRRAQGLPEALDRYLR